MRIYDPIESLMAHLVVMAFNGFSPQILFLNLTSFIKLSFKLETFSKAFFSALLGFNYFYFQKVSFSELAIFHKYESRRKLSKKIIC
jgi:hypothetical protein